MRTKLIIGSLLLLVAVAAAAAWWHNSHITPPEAMIVPDVEPAEDDGVRPEITWSDSATPADQSSPEGLYNDLKAASEDVHEKPALELERIPPPPLPPPTRGEDDDPG